VSKGQPLYEPTERLIALRASDPALAAHVEGLCVALLATRGPLIVHECDAILANAMRWLEPWVRLTAPMPVAERQEKMEHKRRSQACA
jgi:hypothetical protein